MLSRQFTPLLLGLLLVAPGTLPAAAPSVPPNVVLILTDDLGWQDVKCYDIDAPSPMETPNIDALSREGVLFWQAYSPAPTCAPSRCAIMSGNHPARAQKTHVVGGGAVAPVSKTGWRVITPWYSGRMPENEITLAKLLRTNGYNTGHAGKWHMAIDHNAFPQPEDQGFTYTRSNRGATTARPDRLKDFATDKPGDPYRLDSNGFLYHQNTEDALQFLRESTDKPFFLYFATWLVHTPIHTRNERLLRKYCDKLGVKADDTFTQEGQKNPFYCAMVEELDYHVGRIITYLKTTDDPRRPGSKLYDNTYLIFTSDNGGMEQHPGEVITDNYPLDRGKISAREGGVRVPLIIAGPDIPKAVQSDVMVNGLDFYPTVLAWTHTQKPAEKHLDGCDLSSLLRTDPKNPALIKDADGNVRDTMVWHFPHSVAMESTIRIGDYKLIRKYDAANNPAVKSPLELFQLYDSTAGSQKRVDIEEAKNLATVMPEKAAAMNTRLTEILSEMKASYPYLNPAYKRELPNKEKVPVVSSANQAGGVLTVRYRENGAAVTAAQLLYTTNGGERYEEWFRAPAAITAPGTVTAAIPAGSTHLFINLVDENNYLVSYPEALDEVSLAKGKHHYSDSALPTAPARKK